MCEASNIPYPQYYTCTHTLLHFNTITRTKTLFNIQHGYSIREVMFTPCILTFIPVTGNTVRNCERIFITTVPNIGVNIVIYNVT